MNFGTGTYEGPAAVGVEGDKWNNIKDTEIENLQLNYNDGSASPVSLTVSGSCIFFSFNELLINNAYSSDTKRDVQ